MVVEKFVALDDAVVQVGDDAIVLAVPPDIVVQPDAVRAQVGHAFPAATGHWAAGGYRGPDPCDA